MKVCTWQFVDETDNNGKRETKENFCFQTVGGYQFTEGSWKGCQFWDDSTRAVGLLLKWIPHPLGTNKYWRLAETNPFVS